MSKKKFYVTTPIYYVNDKPHVGHAYTNVAADVLARHHRLKGEDVFLLTGTDEHGQKVESAARAKGMVPKDFVDELSKEFLKMCELMNIQYDKFIRTTDRVHKKVVVDIIKKCVVAGDIYKGEYEGQYCMPCESYWTPLQLVSGNCPSCGRVTKEVCEETYFFRLSKYQQRLLDFYKQHPLFLSPVHRSQEIISRVEEGLKDLSITRTAFKWGVPFPLDKKHVTYVWYDALTNYLSGVGYPGMKFKKFWPADVHVVGKEINWFHAVIWPAMLFSAGIEPPKKVYAHGWLTINGEKMSKSKGNVLSPGYLVERYGVDVVRYFLLREIAFGMDGDFSEDSLVARNNAELADVLGNLVQRSVVLLEKYAGGVFPSAGEFLKDDKELIAALDVFEKVDMYMDSLEFHRALECIWSCIGACNKYITLMSPWNMSDEKRRGTVLYCLAEFLRCIAIFVWPFMPHTGELIAQAVGQKVGLYNDAVFKRTTRGKVQKGDILFKKLDKRPEDFFSRVDLRVARVLSVENHPRADRLYVLKVDLGSEQRTLVAGLRQFVPVEELKGRLIVVVANLKPHDFRGVVSQGMLLAADKDGMVCPVEPRGAKEGDTVTAEGVRRQPVAEMTIEEFAKIILTTKDGHVVYGMRVLKTNVGPVFSEIKDGARIK